jgi:multicomponent Na+:H+ antiporter subunit D
VFGETLITPKLPLPEILLLLSLLAMFAASFTAIFQDNLKRLFAYSSIGQIGYITLGLSFDSVSGTTASIVHLFNHGITKAAIFLLIGGMVFALAKNNAVPPAPTFDRLAGLAKRMPLTCFGIVIAGLSLIGVPGTAGFVSKWYLILAAMEKGQFWIVGAILLSSLLAVAYVWRFVEVAYFKPAPEGTTQQEAPLGLLIPAWILVIGTIWFGLDTSFTVGTATEAALQLFKVGQ